MTIDLLTAGALVAHVKFKPSTGVLWAGQKRLQAMRLSRQLFRIDLTQLVGGAEGPRIATRARG